MKMMLNFDHCCCLFCFFVCCSNTITSSVPGPMSNFGLTRSQSTSGVSQVKYVIRRLGAIFTTKVCGIV